MRIISIKGAGMTQKVNPYFVFPPIMALALYATILGYVIPSIRSAFSLTLAQAGLFSTMQSAGTALSVLLCFGVFSALNKPRVMGICAFALALVIVFMGASASLAVLYALFLLLGLFNNVVDTLSNAVIADLAPQKKSFYIGLLQALWSAVAAGGPFFAMLLGNRYSPVFIGLGIFTALCALVFALSMRPLTALPLVQNRRNLGGPGKLLRTLKQKGVKRYVAAAVLNAAVQITMFYYIASYITLTGGGELQRAVTISALFSGMTAGRLIYVRVLHRIPTHRLLPAAAALAFVSYSAMLLCTPPVLICVFAFSGGFGMSANFPAYVVDLCTLVPEDTAAASSLAFLGYTLAAFAAPPVFGAVGDALGLQTAMLAACALLLPLIAVSLTLRSRPKTA